MDDTYTNTPERELQQKRDKILNDGLGRAMTGREIINKAMGFSPGNMFVTESLRHEMESHPMGSVLLQAWELCKKKNADYGSKKDIFENFRHASTMGLKDSQGVATRLSDKWQRFKKGVRTDWAMDIKEELAEDTCLDIINYAAIYLCLYREESDKIKTPTSDVA